MSRYRTLTLVVALGLAAVSVTAFPALGQSAPASAPSDHEAARAQHINARIDARLNRMAERLQLEPSQQAAWATYAQTVKRLFAAPHPKPPAEADAATLLRFRAERAAAHAQRMTQLAEATETLQYALTDEQRETLNQMMRKGHGKHARHRHRDRES